MGDEEVRGVWWWLAAPPQAEESLAQRVSVAWWALLCGLATISVVAGLSLVQESLQVDRYLFIVGGLALLGLVGLRLGWVELATRLTVLSISAVIFFLTLHRGGVMGDSVVFVPVMTILAALVVGPRMGGAVTVAGVLLLFWAHVMGASTDLIQPGELPEQQTLTSMVLATLVCGVLSSYAIYRARSASDVAVSRSRLVSEANAQLQDTKAYAEAVVQSMAEPVLVTDSEGMILRANDAAVSQLRAGAVEALVGRSMRSLLGVDGLARLGGNTTPGLTARAELEVKLLDAGLLPMAVSRSRLSVDGAEAHEVWILADITHRLETEARSLAAAVAAEDANRSKSHFLANMSHELRTPLNAVLGYSEMLMEDVEDEAQRADLQKIHVAGEHLLSLINDVLDMSKIEAGRMELHVETVHIDRLLHDVQATVEPLVALRENTLSWVVASDLGLVVTDSRRLQQILLNLLSNASKFTTGGKVTLDVRRAEGGLRFDVKDTGIGISPTKLAQLFRPFTQGDTSTSRKYGGTGLGLALSQKLATLLGGRIDVESVEGVGSTFSLWLPGGQRHGLEAQASNTQIAALTLGDGPLVLCIDDDPPTLELLSRALHREGYRVITAATGHDGLQIARQAKPAVITLDVMMPEMDGWSVLRALKQDPDVSGIPVVMVSMLDQRGAGLALGASDYLVKPVQGGALVRALQRHLHAASGTVMVVDDAPEVREMLRRALSAEGWSVLEAENAKHALTLLEQVVPDAVVLDLLMPEMDGFQFVEVIRADPRFSDLPVLVLTSMDLSRADRDRLRASTEHVLQKGDGGLNRVVAEVRRFDRGGAGLLPR